MKANESTPTHQQAISEQPTRDPSYIWELMSWFGVITLLFFIILAIPKTSDWSLMHDAPIMHYIAQQMLDGAIPYRDLFDMNMPVTYFIHMGVLLTLGSDAESWRVFDLAWLALTCITILIFCHRQGWLAGFMAATIFASLHISSGEMMAGQRDFLMAPFIVMGGHWIANVTENKYRLLASLLAGIAFGMAFWIKPYIAILFIALFLYAKIQSRSIFVSLLLLTGFLIPATGVLGYLYVNEALIPWWQIVSQYLIPIYSTLGSGMSSYDLIYTMLASLGILLPFLALSTPLTGRFFVTLLGVLYGVVHFLIQQKGFAYHLSPLFVFAAMFAAYRIGSNIKATRTAPRFAAFVGISLACVLASPLYLLQDEKLEAGPEDNAVAIYNDLSELTKDGDTVQVMDHTSGGIHALLMLGVKQPTRFLRDFHFFTATGDPYVQQLEDEFIGDLKKNKPKAIVITRQSWPNARRGYKRIADSPSLSTLIKSAYILKVAKRPYRIYIRK